jgi:transglutaminase-like putative cysteine protease
MKIQVTHRTVYRFDAPMRGVVQSHRLTPANNDAQTVLEWNVGISDGHKSASFRDGAGDLVETVTVRGQVEELVIEVEGLVETTDLAGVLRGHRERVSPLVYLRRAPATRADQAVRDLAEAAVAGVGDVLSQGHALSLAVREAVEYRPGTTNASTTAAEALAAGQGVCQDHSHLLIAAALSVDIPARYVAGYLFADGDGMLAEASHAWAELYIDGLGWVGFDASNQVCPDDRYIRLGSGFDAVDAAPIRGISQGAGTERMEVDVTVQQVQQ